MTGHGRGECVRDGHNVAVEASSVNRKQADVSVSLPRDLEVLEPEIREEALGVVSRGRVTVRVSVSSSAGVERSMRGRVNMTLARSYVRELRSMARALRVSGDVSLELLARAPGVLEFEGGSVEPRDLWPTVRTALVESLTALVRMREREGRHLAAELRRLLTLMEKAAARIERHAPAVLERYRLQLCERIRAAGLPAPDPRDDRLMKEIVIYSDRSDVTEEIARLKSHFKQVRQCLGKTEPVGRTLDFLSQEMHREVNTIGSKANDSLISGEVVLLKTELEKFREQAQNVE